MSRRADSGRGFERRSASTLFGLPLIHIVGGRDPFTGRRRVACGVIAIGQFAIGIVAVCQFGAGIVAISQFAAGALFGIGQFIAAPVAVAQFAVAVVAGLGQFATAVFTVGQGVMSPDGNGLGQSSLALGSGPGALALTCAPAMLAWIVAFRTLRSMGKNDTRSGHARNLPTLRPCTIGGLQPGPAVLRARVAKGQGVVFDAAELTPVPSHTPHLLVSEFLVEDDMGCAIVRAPTAQLFIAGRDRRVVLEEGDIVEVVGHVRLAPHPDGVQSDYRRAPARWSIDAGTVVGNQSVATVRAMARFPALLAWPMALAAGGTIAAIVVYSVVG